MKINDWNGQRVRSLVPLRNHYAEVPAGTFFTVTKKWGTLSLISDACPTCGISFVITDVPVEDVAILERQQSGQI